jgi:hypothetical protein
LQRVRQRDDLPRTRATQRMPQRYRAAQRVHPRHRHLEDAVRRQHLRRERLVELDVVYRVDADARAPKQFRDGIGRRDAEVLWG